VAGTITTLGTRHGPLEPVTGTSDPGHAWPTSTQVDQDTASTELIWLEVAYRAGMAATARVVQPSLVSFLR
jgi:hypothetical protein